MRKIKSLKVLFNSGNSMELLNEDAVNARKALDHAMERDSKIANFDCPSNDSEIEIVMANVSGIQTFYGEETVL